MAPTMMAQAADTVSSIFAPVSTPAAKEADLAKFVLVLSAVVFVVVAGLITYSVVRFRVPVGEQGPEPPQVYGSAQVEAAWTAVPLIIILVLMLATARVIHEIQAAQQPPNALEVTVVGRRCRGGVRMGKHGNRSVVASRAARTCWSRWGQRPEQVAHASPHRDRLHVRAEPSSGDEKRRTGAAGNRRADHLQHPRAADQPGRRAEHPDGRIPPRPGRHPGACAAAPRRRPRARGLRQATAWTRCRSAPRRWWANCRTARSGNTRSIPRTSACRCR